MALKPFPSNSYVKFVRTNSTLWGSLKSAGSVDNDTLYFVIDDGSDKGSLYLGNTLIASGVKEGVALESLVDVSLSADLGENDILVHNGERWVNQNIYDFAEKPMEGASAEADGKGGLVPQPKQGQQNLFLQGNGLWANPTAELETTVGTLSGRVESLGKQVTTIIGGDADLSMRDVAADAAASAVANLVAGADGAFDTLKEIADWILGNGDNLATGGVDAADLIKDVSDLKALLNTADTGLVDRVENLETKANANANAIDNLVQIIGTENNGLIADVLANTADIEANADDIEANANAITILRELLTWNYLAEKAAV